MVGFVLCGGMAWAPLTQHCGQGSTMELVRSVVDLWSELSLITCIWTPIGQSQYSPAPLLTFLIKQSNSSTSPHDVSQVIFSAMAKSGLGCICYDARGHGASKVWTFFNNFSFFFKGLSLLPNTILRLIRAGRIVLIMTSCNSLGLVSGKTC